MENYIEQAMRTESIEGANERLEKLGVKTDLFNLNKHLVSLVEGTADNLKKHIFYGKDIRLSGGLITGLNKEELSIEQVRLLHAGLGMLTEAQEFLKPILDSILLKNNELDLVNLKEELGDMLWYEAIACNVLGTTFEDEQVRNINKLTARYPDKFTEDAALNRNLEDERKILEDETEELIIFDIQFISDMATLNLELQFKIEFNDSSTEEFKLILTGDSQPIEDLTKLFKGKTLSQLKSYLNTIGDIT